MTTRGAESRWPRARHCHLTANGGTTASCRTVGGHRQTALSRLRELDKGGRVHGCLLLCCSHWPRRTEAAAAHIEWSMEAGWGKGKKGAGRRRRRRQGRGAGAAIPAQRTTPGECSATVCHPMQFRHWHGTRFRLRAPALISDIQGSVLESRPLGEFDRTAEELTMLASYRRGLIMPVFLATVDQGSYSTPLPALATLITLCCQVSATGYGFTRVRPAN